jgi:hypothetical protein
MTEESPKEPSPVAPPPDAPAGEAEEVAVDGEAVNPGPAVDEQQSQEEIRAQLEEEIKKVKVEDVILQSTVSILNLAARRIAKEDERDLPQGKAGIDAVKALLEFLPGEAEERVREAVSELQMLYVKELGGADSAAAEPEA